MILLMTPVTNLSQTFIKNGDLIKHVTPGKRLSSYEKLNDRT